MKKLVIVTILLGSISTYAQDLEDAWVYFTDKENVEEFLANPIAILTQEAIDRKYLHNVSIDERDVPVNEDYISQIKNVNGITVMAKSKWFNCIYVRGTEADIRSLTSLSFVDRLDFADNSLDVESSPTVIRPKKNRQSKNKFEAFIDLNYGLASAQIKQLNADYLHQQNYTGTDMVIAVIDNGFPGVNTIEAFAKARNEGRILDGYDFVDRNDDEFAFTGAQHGTNTFSDIAGFIEGEFIGTAPDAKYYLFRTEDNDSEGPHEEAFWVEAVERADSLGVHVINTSLGYAINFDNPAYEYTLADMDGKTAFSSKGAVLAYEKGMLLVSSAGNEGDSHWGTVTAPGDSAGTLTVGAVTENGDYASFSSIGPSADNRIKPDVMARGSFAVIITANGSPRYANGTSFSSPIMAGAVACLWQAFPSKTNGEIMQMVRESANLYTHPTDEMGYGIPDFKAILETLSSKTVLLGKNIRMYPNPANSVVYFDTLETEAIEVRIFTMDGKEIKSVHMINSNTISLENMSRGLYLVEVISGNKRYATKISKK